MILDLLDEEVVEDVESGGDSLVHYYCALCRNAMKDPRSLCGKNLTGREDVPEGVDEDHDCIVCLDLYEEKLCRRKHYLI